MTFSSQQRQHLRAQAHALKPVVILGNAGLTPAVLSEIDRALDHHQLIKIRINANSKLERTALLNEISQHLQAEPVHLIGRIGILYRQRSEPA